VTCRRELGACPVANRPLAEAQHALLARLGKPDHAVYMRSDAWVAPADLERLAAAPAPAALRDAAGVALAWSAASPRGPAESAESLAAGAESLLIRYPWDLLRVNELLLAAVRSPDLCGELSPLATVEGILVLGEGSRVLPGVFIEGTVVIGRHCKIGPNCYLRGATAIGDDCHIGQAVEIKNSILMNGVGMGHLSYCGDSIVGQNTNFGAGTITANFRHDGACHRSLAGGRLVDTGRRKLGAIIGDGVHTGIHTSIYPGRKLWPGVATRPGEVVQTDLTG